MPTSSRLSQLLSQLLLCIRQASCARTGTRHSACRQLGKHLAQPKCGVGQPQARPYAEVESLRWNHRVGRRPAASEPLLLRVPPADLSFSFGCFKAQLIRVSKTVLYACTYASMYTHTTDATQMMRYSSGNAVHTVQGCEQARRGGGDSEVARKLPYGLYAEMMRYRCGNDATSSRDSCTVVRHGHLRTCVFINAE
jgi:hypothetical protein